MNTTKTILIGIFCTLSLTAYNQDAKEIVRKADEKMRGETSKSIMEMKIIRPTWQRTVAFKSWSKGYDYSLTLVTAPAKEKGQAFLMRENEMWNWNPTINRMIKMPPSMMSQGWMGSDYTNDDILKESSIVVDYNHFLLGEETIAGEQCYKIKLEPKENAAVVWGKIIMWISKEEYYQMKAAYYDEFDDLVKTHQASNIQTMDGRKIPTKIEIIPEDKESQKTEVIIKSIDFNIPLKDSFFSQQNMKRIR